ncbi:MAG: PilZ domain-containing protein [Elusimicrobia bacterium]|nr:PilZ domain-containing protein [Candidatus Obscuribacterium magneticum]
MKLARERRKMKRWKVAVLVRCTIPKFSSEIYELEMWAKDVHEKGMQLEWSRGLGVSHVQKEGGVSNAKSIRFEDVQFTKGAKILVQDLFYDDDGSPFMEGRILWARKSGGSGNWSVGIAFEKGDEKSRAMLGAFKDFLKIIRNPSLAIEKASRK